MMRPLRTVLLILISSISINAVHAQTGNTMRITEFMYSGTGGEFVEFTNVGTTPVDMTGWSYSDASVTPGDVPLTAFGIVQPGESVILTESDPAVFRTAWNLCNGVKVIGSNSKDNLSRSDEIHLYDASNTQIDQLVYNDQGFPGSPRANGASAWVTAAGLGANNPVAWTLSTVSDAEASYKSTNNDLGSPGNSTRAVVAYSPCSVVDPNAPKIALDVTSTSNFLDGGATASPASPYAISGVINDPTDPPLRSGSFSRQPIRIPTSTLQHSSSRYPAATPRPFLPQT